MLTKEELLTPRFICTGTGIHHYPGSPFLPGDILTQFEHSIYGVCVAKDKDSPVGEWQYADQVKEYPHLFKSLKWWDERSIEEMPMFIRHEHGGAVVKIKSWDMIKNIIFTDNLLNGWHGISDLIHPSTEEEYNAYINKTK